MKELSIEQKAKRYDEAIDVAKRNYETIVQMDDDCTFAKEGMVNTFLHIFPELKESEDEQHRKWILEYLYDSLRKSDEQFKDQFKCAIAWLEKQDESDETKAKVFLINKGYPIDTNGIFPTYEEMYNIIREGLKKQGEQEHTDKVAPKFKVGDWIVQKNLGIYKIVEVCETWYEVISYKDGIQYSIGFDKENDCHLWTIQDAKEGDVLYSLDSCQPFIYKGRKSHEQATAYCGINKYDKFFVEKTEDYIIVLDKYVPATKEQCDLLFSKMHEAGYKWDAEKKELKNRVQQHPQKWSKDDERKELKKINAIKAEHGKYYYCIKDYFSGGKKFSSKGDVVQALNGLPIIGLEDISEYFLPVNNVYNNVWSEEDRRMIESIIKHLEMQKNYQTNTTNIEQCQNWVKSLEDRVQPKPKQEWSEEDEPKKELAETYLKVFDKKFPILPTLRGKQLADYKNFLNKCQQIFGLKYWGIRPLQAKLFEKLSLLWAAWGAEHLQGLGQTYGDMDDEISMWSEEDEKMLEDVRSNFEYNKGEMTDALIEQYNHFFDKIKHLQPQPKQEWSEDDEANLDYLIDFCNGYYNGNKPVLTESTARSLSNWLYQLKSCEIMSKTNKIDNEEAEKNIHLVCEFIRHRMGSNGNIGGIDYEELIKRLKSLRPQNRWKPSDEQLKHLKQVVDCSDEGWNIDVLDSLYEDLKKL